MELTEDRLAFIIDNWSKMTAKQMGEELGVNDGTISGWGTMYRKMGGELPRKSRILNTQLQDTMAKFIASRGGTPIHPTTKKPYELTS